MEENTNEVEVELSEELLDAFDESWSEESDNFDDETDEGSEPSDEPVDEPEPEQAEDGNPEPEHDDEPAEAPEEAEEPRTETETGNQRFKIKYNGNEEEYGLDEFTTLAQKGRNYDHVVEDRDAWKGKGSEYEAFLKELADRAGVSIEEQMDLTRAMWLMDAEAEKGNTLTEAEALLRVQRNRNTALAQEAAEDENTARISQEINRFRAIYGDVKYEDIPKEVWDVANVTNDLLGAYQAYEIKQLKNENEKLKQTAQNERNAKRSTGPLKSTGSGHKKDAFDEGWDSEF